MICRLGCMAGVSGHHSAGWRADGVLHFLGVKLRGERREEPDAVVEAARRRPGLEDETVGSRSDHGAAARRAAMLDGGRDEMRCLSCLLSM